MKFREIISRITGFSIPIFGIQWNPPEAECAAAKRVLTFLEDRRVLYIPSEMEVPHYCVESIIRIREFLTDELGKLHSNNELAQNLRAMRSACRKFLNTVQADDHIVQFGAHHDHFASWIFNGAVGELRGTFGIHIACIAASHGLDIEDDLASILPIPSDDD
jgi:hypothetical protein